MHRKFIAIALLLITVLQGPVVSYASTLGWDDAMSRACGGQMLGANKCDACCTHGSMPSCMAQCPVPIDSAVPLVLPASARVAVRGVMILDDAMAPFVDFDPPHPLRPPIV